MGLGSGLRLGPWRGGVEGSGSKDSGFWVPGSGVSAGFRV